MALKIAGHLFTGPFPVAETVVRPNHDPAVWAVVAKEGQPWDPAFRLLALGSTGEGGLVFRDHPDAANWESAGTTVGVYLLSMPRKEHSAIDQEGVRRAIEARYPPPNAMIIG